MAISLFACDQNFVMRPIQGWTKFSATKKLDEVGTWTLVIPSNMVGDLIGPGTRLVVYRDDQFFMAGPFESPERSWSMDSADATEVKTFNGADDLLYIAVREVYSVPSAEINNQIAESFYDRPSTNAEALIRELVSYSVGPTALASRRFGPPIVLGPVGGCVGNATFHLRGNMLMEVIRAAIVQAGQNTHVRVTQVGNQLQFVCYPPRDLRRVARFSAGFQNLRSYTLTGPSMPGVTRAHVAGQGVGIDRNLREYPNVGEASADEALWNIRVEHGWINKQDTNDPSELDKAGNEDLIINGSAAALSTVTVETPMLRFGYVDPADIITGFDLGDIVTVELADGAEFAASVREAALVADPKTGDQLTVLIGSANSSTTPAWIKAVKDLNRRIGIQERI